MAKLAALKHETGDTDGARTDVRRALAMQKRALATAHRPIGRTSMVIGETLMAPGEPAEAIGPLRAAMTAYEGSDANAERASLQRTLARALLQTKDEHLAEELLVEAAAAFDRQGEPEEAKRTRVLLRSIERRP